jgi:hypothetical protein
MHSQKVLEEGIRQTRMSISDVPKDSNDRGTTHPGHRNPSDTMEGVELFQSVEKRMNGMVPHGLQVSHVLGLCQSRLRTEKPAGIGVCLMAAGLKSSESFLAGIGKGPQGTTPEEGVENITFQRAVQKRLDARRARPEE